MVGIRVEKRKDNIYIYRYVYVWGVCMVAIPAGPSVESAFAELIKRQ